MNIRKIFQVTLEKYFTIYKRQIFTWHSGPWDRGAGGLAAGCWRWRPGGGVTSPGGWSGGASLPGTRAPHGTWCHGSPGAASLSANTTCRLQSHRGKMSRLVFQIHADLLCNCEDKYFYYRRLFHKIQNCVFQRWYQAKLLFHQQLCAVALPAEPEQQKSSSQ